MPMRLHALDLLLVAAYLAGVTLFGLRFRKRSESLSSYFLASREVPWWAIALSVVSAETSTLTIISVPGIAFGANYTFLQLVFGYMVGRLVLCALFLPRYFEGEMFTAYQLIDRRFGRTLHKVTAGLFLLTRAAAEGVRVFAVSIVIGLAIGTGDVASIAVISVLTLLYTFEGGMTAVIWTDVVQMVLYIAGTLVALFTLGSKVAGGWAAIHAAASAAGKLQVLDFAWNLHSSYTFWAGIVGGTFLTMASHGTDQLMVQRLLAAKNLRESRMALLASGGVVLLQFTLFLIIGTGLWLFYAQHPAARTVSAPDRLFPAFIVQQMPTGVAGLLIAAILAAAMSNLSAALNSLASSSVVDFFLRMRPHATDRQRTLFARGSTVAWAAVLFAIAVYSVRVGGKGHVVEIGLSIASVAYGPLLGVFLLGTLTRFATEGGAIAGMVTGFAINLMLYLPHVFPGFPSVHVGSHALASIAFTWYVLIGSVVTFAVGSLASIALPGRKAVSAGVTILLLGTLASAPHARAQQPAPATASEADFSAVDQAINDAIAAHQLPGAVLVVGHGGHVVYRHAYGNRAIEPAPEAMTEDTVFDMASLSKVLSTSVAVMELIQQGRVGLDDPVVKYLPAFAANGKSNITVRDLLTHYSGLPPDVDLKESWSGKETGIRLAIESVPYGPPGKTFRYSDINFITLGAIVEKVSGEPLNVYAAQHVFGPLGMTHTRYLPPASLIPHIAPTAHNDDLAMTHDELLRGTVHDPTTRRMGGVAGHAGVFSTAGDTAAYAQALLDRLAGRPSHFPLTTATLQIMCQPQQPSGGRWLRGLGWDIESPFSRPRGELFPVGSFGHTGFTGTSLWMDPRSDTYVVLLTNAVHPRGGHNITPLRGKVATEVTRTLGLYGPGSAPVGPQVRTGIDQLESTNFAALRSLHPRRGGLRVGLLTNQTGLDSTGRRTIDVLAEDLPRALPGARLVSLFSPEHGILGVEDREGIRNAVDTKTGLPVISLYGAHEADRRPTAEQMQNLDAVVIDLQDAGVRFYTYETLMGYFLEAASKSRTAVVVLDRPALDSGVDVLGPVSDERAESYTDYMREPIVHGMTLGELARFFNGERDLGANLAVVPMSGWQRGLWYGQTGVPWVNPSPNLRNSNAAAVYPGLALLEMISVGRGTDAPFEQFGAPCIASGADAQRLADALNARKIMGVEFAATSFTPEKPYPYAGTLVHGVRITVTDRTRLDAPEMGVELLSALHKQYPQHFPLANANRLLDNKATIDAIEAGKDPREIEEMWEPELMRFREVRAKYLLYGFLPPQPASTTAH